MAIDFDTASQTASEYAKEAAAVAGKLKPGTYEAAQCLALVSIAHSLAILAERPRQA
jgi:hypothetical protein